MLYLEKKCFNFFSELQKLVNLPSLNIILSSIMETKDIFLKCKSNGMMS